MTVRISQARAALGLAAALAGAGCTIDLVNREPARELARQTHPAGSPYAGWRVFEDRCARCHGPDATGTDRAPDLLPRVRDMGVRRFASLVLQRYDWTLPLGPSRAASGVPDAALEAVLQGDEPAVTMPAWQGEPRVSAHIVDLYAFLSARAQGTLGPGKPPQ